MSNNRPTGTIIRQLDATELGAFIATKLGKPNARPTYDYALAEGKDGLVLLCSEGVGYYFTEDAWLSATIETPKEGGGAYLGWDDFTVTADELADIPTTNTDLADFIRVFGARLESNFAIWRNELA